MHLRDVFEFSVNSKAGQFKFLTEIETILFDPNIHIIQYECNTHVRTRHYIYGKWFSSPHTILIYVGFISSIDLVTNHQCSTDCTASTNAQHYFNSDQWCDYVSAVTDERQNAEKKCCTPFFLRIWSIYGSGCKEKSIECSVL